MFCVFYDDFNKNDKLQNFAFNIKQSQDEDEKGFKDLYVL